MSTYIICPDCGQKHLIDMAYSGQGGAFRCPTQGAGRTCNQCGKTHQPGAATIYDLLREIGCEPHPYLAMCLFDALERVRDMKARLAKYEK